MLENNSNNFNKFTGKNLTLNDFEEIVNSKKKQKFTILGKGNFAYTEKMKYKYGTDDDFYAIKKLEITHIQESEQKKLDLKRETKLHEKLSNENIVKFYSYFFDEENINKYKEIYKDDKKKNVQNERINKKIACLVLEYLPNGTLTEYINNYLEKNKNENIPQPFVIKVFREILEGLMYLKSKKILHRDIKPDNILFDKNYTAKISDFGISALCNKREEENEEDNDENKENEDEKNNIEETDKDLYMNNSFIGDKNFVSYEITQRKKYDYQTDVYSLGITIFYMMTGSLPCYTAIGRNTEGKQFIIRKRNFNAISNYYCYELRNLIENMINRNPKKRPTIEQVYEELMKIEFPLKNIGDTLADFEGKDEKKMYKKNYLYYYVKKYANNKINIPIFQKLLYKQNKIFKKLSHKNIIKYYGLLEDQLLSNNPPGIKDYFLIYEYLPNGSLADMIENNKNKLFTENFIIKIFKQILSGLKFLHFENIAHGNLKPNIILFDSKYNIKIAGFDYFGLYEDKHYKKAIVRDDILFINNHYKYMGPFTSPEMMEGLDWNDKADIFSLGLIMICLLSNPSQFQKLYTVNGNLKRDIYLNNINKIYSQKLSSLVSKMVNENPENRPSSNDVYDELIKIEKELKKNPTYNNINIKNFIILSFPMFNNNSLNSSIFMGNDNISESKKFGNFTIYEPKNNNFQNNNQIMNNNNLNIPNNNFNMPINNFNMPNNNFNIPNNNFNMPNNNFNMPINTFNNIANNFYNNNTKNKINNNNNNYLKNNINCDTNIMPNNNFNYFDNNMSFNNQINSMNINMNNNMGINNSTDTLYLSANDLNNSNTMTDYNKYFNNSFNNNTNNKNNFDDIVMIQNDNKNLLNQIYYGQKNFDPLSTYIERKDDLQNVENDYLNEMQVKILPKGEDKKIIYYLNYLSSDDVIEDPYFSGLYPSH